MRDDVKVAILIVAFLCIVPWDTVEADFDQAAGACFGKLREALEEIDTLQDELSDLKLVVASSQDGLALCKQELDDLEELKLAAAKTDTDASAYKKQLDDAKTVLEELQQELEKTVAVAEYEKKAAELRTSREQLKKSVAAVESLTADLQQQKQELANLQKLLEDSRKEYGSLRSENSRLQKRLEQTRNKLESIPGLHDQIAAADIARLEAQEQVAALQAEVTQLKRRLMDNAAAAETLLELEARLQHTEAARQAAADAQQLAEQQLAAVQQTLSQLLVAIAQREQYEALQQHYVTAFMPYWMEARWNATKAGATTVAMAAHDAVARAVTACTSAVYSTWAQQVEPAVAAGYDRLVITGNRLKAVLKGWWLHRLLPLVSRIEGIIEAQLGEGWPRLKQAMARAAAALSRWAGEAWTLCLLAAHAAHSRMEAVAVQQMVRVPALQQFSRQPYVDYVLVSLLLVLLAPLVAVRVLRAAPQQPRRRQFIPKLDAGAQLRPTGPPLSPKKED